MRGNGMTTRGIITLLAALVFAPCVQAADTVIKVPYGITRMPLLRNGLMGAVALAWRENYNAHGFGILTLYAEQTTTEDQPHALLLVPVFDAGKEKLEITVGGGADCRLDDVRLVRGEGDDIQLITAHRDLGKGYAEDEKVTFKYFDLTLNTDREVGKPLYYFNATKTVAAKQAYCDVNEAFKTELGLGPYQNN